MNSKNILIKGVACGAIIVAMGVTAFAATTQNTGVIAKIDAKTNVTMYSIDNGKTWSKNAPQGLKDQNANQSSELTVQKVLADGTIAVEPSNPDNLGKGVMVKINTETKEAVYSIDGGKTWSKNAPQGLKDQNVKQSSELTVQKVLADGTIVVEESNPDNLGKGIMAKINTETKEAVYSTDGGKTWTTKLPSELK